MYYDKRHWVDLTRLAGISLEEILSKYLFNNDKERAIYSSKDYAYRRRFELIDTSEKFENVQASSLQLPFFNYTFSNATWSPKKEVRTFSSEEFGILAPSQVTSIRIIPATTSLTVYFHFDREDDFRLAQDVLQFLGSTYRYSYKETSFLGSSIKIPFRFEFKTVKRDSIREEEWLKKQKIFLLEADVEVYTQIFFPIVNYVGEESINESEFYILSEKVISNFMTGKYSNEYTVDDIFEDTDIYLSQFSGSSTYNSIKLFWSFVDQDKLEKLTLTINGSTTELSPDTTYKTIRNLLEGVEYEAVLLATKAGVSKKFLHKFTTSSRIEDKDDLVGTTW